MLRKRLLIAGAATAALIIAPIAWYLISPLFITRTVDEAFPAVEVAPAKEARAVEALPARPTPAMPAMAEQTMPTITTEAMPARTGLAMAAATDAAMSRAGDAMQETMPDAMPEKCAPPPAEPVALLSGQFHAVEHEGMGAATIYRLPDGKHVLRLENFEVLNGPDLYVYLSGALDANDEQAILDGGYVSLGRLKGNKGNQNYELPPDLDLSKYHSVSIWCQRFRVNFATAPLT